MTDDAKLFSTVHGALITSLPEDTPSDVIAAAAREIVAVLHAPWFPSSEKKIVNATNVNVRDRPGGNPIGTVKKDTGVRAGSPENGWTPILFHGWVSGEMLG